MKAKKKRCRREEIVETDRKINSKSFERFASTMCIIMSIIIIIIIIELSSHW